MAGYWLTGTAKEENMRVIAVVMNEPDSAKRSSDTSKMLDYGFNVYMVKNIIDENTTLSKVKVELGEKLTTDIVSKETITILSKKSDKERNITYETQIDKIVAPIKRGDIVGKINILEDGKVISTIDATIKENIDKANIFTIFLRNLKEIIKGSFIF